jgi:hypothetical protein
MLPGWSRRTRFLTAIPALLPGVIVAVFGVVWFVSEARFYLSLPMSERMADGDPLSAEAGMAFAGAVIVAGLLWLVPGLVTTLPKRFNLALMVAAIILGAIPLVLGFSFLHRIYVWLPFAAYPPVLAMLRFFLQRRADRQQTKTQPSQG